MTAGSVDANEDRAPVLVLGLGNILLRDDGVGPRLVRELYPLYTNRGGVELIDGGTQGMALLGYLGQRRALVILDAVSCGNAAGAISVLDRRQLMEMRVSRATTAHEGNAGELLAAASLLGDLPEHVWAVGIEPEEVRTGTSLSRTVQAAFDEAREVARKVIEMALDQCIRESALALQKI